MSLQYSSLTRIPAISSAPGHNGLLQRKCSCGKAAGPEGECEECKKKREPGPTLQRKSGQPAAHSQSSTEAAPPIVHDVLRSPGQPLDAASRAFMEPRFGYDFSRVRVHADSRAAKSADAVNAQAYTVGSNIVFGANQSGTGKLSSQRLLAHELAHVVQQGGRQAGGSLQVAPANDSAEGAADRAADQALSGGRVASSPKAESRLQRFGANPRCTATETSTIHDAITTASGWAGSALTALAANPMAPKTLAALQHNFGTAGTAANAGAISARLSLGRSDMLTIPYSCNNASNDPSCAALHCGDSPPAGGHASNICTNVTTVSSDPVFRAGCILHEAMHACHASMTAAADSYSGWFGHSGSTAGYPGTNPLANADSYTTLAMELK
jgi:hypothetical protein